MRPEAGGYSSAVNEGGLIISPPPVYAPQLFDPRVGVPLIFLDYPLPRGRERTVPRTPSAQTPERPSEPLRTILRRGSDTIRSSITRVRRITLPSLWQQAGRLKRTL
jgi:hypothetical protein